MTAGARAYNFTAVLGAFAAACAGGVVVVFGFGIRQLAFGSMDNEAVQFGIVLPGQLCAALGALAAGALASSRPMRGPALLAIAIAAVLMFISEGFYQNGARPLELTIMVSVLSALGTGLTVLGLISITQTTDSSRAFFVMTALTVSVVFPYILRELNLPPDLTPYLAALGLAAVVILVWGTAALQRPEPRLAFAPVGPAPLSVRSIPSQTPQLALLVIAATVANWTALQAQHLRGAYFENFDLLAVGLVIAFGSAAAVIGESMAGRAGAVALLIAFVWALGGGPPEVALLAASLAGSLADFSAVVLGSRYGQPGEAPRRIGALMALGAAAYIPLNLLSLSSGDEGLFSGEGGTMVLVAAGASGAFLLVLLQLPRARSPSAAW